MGLKGILEDLPILDMLQIVGFSTKTGYLRIASPFGPGAVIFKDGRIHCALSPSTWEHARRLTADGTVEESLLTRCTEVALRELVQFRAGSFEFELTQELDAKFEDLDLTPFLAGAGLNVQHSLLDLSREMDEERRDALEIVETADEEEDEADTSTIAMKPLPNVQVVLVDDEEDVVGVVGDELGRHGYAVGRATNPRDALRIAEDFSTSDAPVVVVSDLKMPTSSGDSFLGGLEVVEGLLEKNLRCPVILMAESLPYDLRERAAALGVRKVSFKPTLTKPDPELYREDLAAFARELLKQLGMVVSEPVDAEADGAGAGGPHAGYVASISARLASTKRRTDVTRAVLQAASKWMERGILFVVRGRRAVGFSGFGISEDALESEALARQLTVDVSECPTFERVLRTGDVHGPTTDLDDLEGPIYGRIGRGEASEGVLFPMLNHGEVIMILYADNPATGTAVVRPGALEIILTRAGAALESALLERKLDEFGRDVMSEMVAR